MNGAWSTSNNTSLTPGEIRRITILSEARNLLDKKPSLDNVFQARRQDLIRQLRYMAVNERDYRETATRLQLELSERRKEVLTNPQMQKELFERVTKEVRGGRTGTAIITDGNEPVSVLELVKRFREKGYQEVIVSWRTAGWQMLTKDEMLDELQEIQNATLVNRINLELYFYLHSWGATEDGEALMLKTPLSESELEAIRVLYRPDEDGAYTTLSATLKAVKELA